VEPNEFSLTAAIAACERAGQWEQASLSHPFYHTPRPILAIFPVYLGSDTPYSITQFVFSICQALALFFNLRETSGEPLSTSLWTSAISAAASGGELELASNLIWQMKETGLTPSTKTYNACLKACERSAEGECAVAFLAEMRSQGLQPDVISYTSLLGALGRAARWEQAVGVWGAMAAEGVEPDDRALRTMMRTLTQNGQPQAALAVFESAERAAVANSSLVYAATLEALAAESASAVIASKAAVTSVEAAEKAACAVAAARRATALLERLESSLRLPPSADGYRAAVRACAAAAAVDEAQCGWALRLWRAMVSSGSQKHTLPEITSLSITMSV